MNISSISILCITLSLFGYEVIAAFSTIAGVVSTPYAIAMRGLVVFTSLAVIVYNVSKSCKQLKNNTLAFGSFLFWVLYLFRIFYSTAFSTEVLAYNWTYYWIWSVGACLVPITAILLMEISTLQFVKFFKYSYLILMVCGLAATFKGSGLELDGDGELAEKGRLVVAALNPISMGQLGASILILSIWALCFKFQQISFTVKLLVLINIAIGAYLIVGSNSRGPLLSALACMLYMILFSSRKIKFYITTILGIFIIIFPIIALYVEDNYGFSTYSRIVGENQIESESTTNRLDRYYSVWSDFVQNPLFGSGLEEPIFGGYPHNIFVEGYMSTGIIGGTLLTMIMLLTTIHSIKIYKHNAAYSWISLIFVQYITSAQFSGAIYASTHLWITVTLIITIRKIFKKIEA
jgi:hypothetical protein